MEVNELNEILAGLKKGPYAVIPFGEKAPLYTGYNVTGLKYGLKKAIGTVAVTAGQYGFQLSVAEAMQVAGAL